MKLIKTSIAFFTLSLLLSVTSCNPQEKYSEFGDGLYAEFVTSKDTMVAQLFYDKVPLTVANFVALAEGTHPMVDEKFKGKPFYNGLTFHRVMDQFMIQGGDPEGSGRGGPGYKFGTEFEKSLNHDKPGMLSMANSGGLNTNGSQFFITEVPYPSLNTYDNNGNIKPCERPRVSCHCVFGELVKGVEVQDAISNVEVDARKKPLEDVILKEVNIIRIGYEARNFDAVKTWNTELPLIAEKQAKLKEEAAKAAEEARQAAEAKANEAAAEALSIFSDYKSKATKSSTGLMTYVIKEGNGTKVKQGDNVTVWYEGYFAADGKLLDTNRKDVDEKSGRYNEQKEQMGRYNPMPMPISPDAALIAGFKEAGATMSVGEKKFAYIPSHLAWGEAGSPPTIQPNSDVIFIIEVIEIVN